MKDYLVTHVESNKIFLVLAKDVKDAIQQVYEKYEEIFYKEDLKARSLGSLHNESGKVVILK